MFEGATCFLIDDDPDDREIFCIALEDTNKGFKCITAPNGKEALQKLSTDDSFRPDYIFLDLNMPVMNGKQCLQEIKKIPRLESVPVIIYTTSSYVKDMEETKELGATHFLTKPSRIDRLTRLLEELIENNNLPFAIS